MAKKWFHECTFKRRKLLAELDRVEDVVDAQRLASETHMSESKRSAERNEARNRCYKAKAPPETRQHRRGHSNGRLLECGPSLDAAPTHLGVINLRGASTAAAKSSDSAFPLSSSRRSRRHGDGRAGREAQHCAAPFPEVLKAGETEKGLYKSNASRKKN